MVKKVTCYMGSLLSGGAEHQMSILANMLVEKGYDVTIVTCMIDKPDFYTLDSRIKRKRIAVGKSPIRKIISLFFDSIFVKTDVVITWGHMQSVAILLALLFRPSIKVIGGERNYTGNNSSFFENVLYKTGLYNRTSSIVPNNYSQAEYLCRKYPKYKSKIYPIVNYTDIAIYNPTPIPHNEIIQVGIFARVEKQKNFVLFIEAMGILKQKTKQQFKIHWFGNHEFSSEHQRTYYQAGLEKIKQNDLENNVFIYNPIKDVASEIQKFDVLCLPSLWEGFSNSISEYICCARPILCSDVSDNHIMVRDGINGYLFDPSKPNDIAGAFIKFFNLSKNERDLMGVNSRQIAESLFSKDKFVNAYIKLIEE